MGGTELIENVQVVESRCGVAAAEDVDSPAVWVLHRSRHVAGARLRHRAGTRECRPLQLLRVEEVHVDEGGVTAGGCGPAEEENARAARHGDGVGGVGRRLARCCLRRP